MRAIWVMKWPTAMLIDTPAFFHGYVPCRCKMSNASASAVNRKIGTKINMSGLRSCQQFTDAEVELHRLLPLEQGAKRDANGRLAIRMRHRCAPPSFDPRRRSRRALPITLTEESDIAAAAITGDRRMPKVG